MEMFVIALIALAAFAVVLVPLFRRRTGADAHEFDAAPLRSRPETGEGVVPPMAAGPATPVAPAGAMAPDAPAEPAVPDAQTQTAGDDELEREVARYRAALRAGTLCRKCGAANPPDSRFCAECGAGLPLTDAEEFV
jgi:ribosomal protein L40E